MRQSQGIGFAMSGAGKYDRPMKRLLFALSAQISLLLSACSVTGSSVDEVGSRLEEGLQGRGQIVPNDPVSDDFGPEYR
jgi:hypothetical protein